jgi:hypothetical protein
MPSQPGAALAQDCNQIHPMAKDEGTMGLSALVELGQEACHEPGGR